MKYFIIISTLVISLCSSAETRYSVVMGSDAHEILWLRQKKIKNKEIYIMGYQSPQKRQLERVMPRQEFSAEVKELQNLKSEFSRAQAQNANPFCNERVLIENNKKSEILCLDFVSSKEKEKLVLWVEQKSNMVIGIN